VSDHHEPRVRVTDRPGPAVEGVVGGGFRRFNVAQSGVDDSRPLAVVVSDPVTDEVLGGLIGRTSLGLLFIDPVYLPEALRGGGLGARILRLAEDEGRRRGCRAAVLYTISFQAPAFYERLGWQRFGEIACEPPGPAASSSPSRSRKARLRLDRRARLRAMYRVVPRVVRPLRTSKEAEP
jgi:GNAT superfamily N-acetyltransferase